MSKRPFPPPPYTGWQPQVGEMVRYAARHVPGKQAKPDTTGTITLVHGGPLGGRMLVIDDAFIRLEDEVVRVTR